MKKISCVILVIVMCFSLVACGQIMSSEQALNIAINEIGISQDQIAKSKIELDKELFGSKYDIEIDTVDGDEYEFEIDASSGKIISGTAAVSTFNTNLIAPETPEVLSETNNPVSDTLTLDEAITTAIKDAGIDESTIIEKNVELEKSLKGDYYEVDFETISTEYEYKISLSTGEILSSKTEINN